MPTHRVKCIPQSAKPLLQERLKHRIPSCAAVSATSGSESGLASVPLWLGEQLQLLSAATHTCA
jgi:hypothetical protein